MGLTLTPALISNDMLSKVCEEITDPWPNFNGCTIEFDCIIYIH